MGTSNTDVEVVVGIRPTTCLKQIWIQWTADSGVKTTLRLETGWKEMKKHNMAAKLNKNCIMFVPYGTKQTLPMLGKTKVQLQCGTRHYKYDQECRQVEDPKEQASPPSHPGTEAHSGLKGRLCSDYIYCCHYCNFRKFQINLTLLCYNYVFKQPSPNP